MRKLRPVLLSICVVAPELTAQAGTTRRGVIRGVVLDTLGRPYSQVIVELQRQTIDGVTPRGDTLRSYIIMRSDTTADDGRFEFPSLERQAYRLAFHTSFFVSGAADSVDFSDSSDTTSVELRARVRRPVFETPDVVRKRRLAELADAKARWNARRVSRYRLTAQIECFCFAAMEGKATLEFRNDTLFRVTSRRGRHGPNELPWFVSFSVPRLFDEVEKAIRSREVIVEVVEFDPTFGVPTRLDTDTAYGGYDGYYRWRISDFQPSR